MSETDEFNTILESLVESGTCSKATADKIRLARKAGDALGRKRSRFLLATVLIILAPAFAGIAVVAPTGINVACGLWASFSAIAGLFLAIMTAAEMP